MRLKKEFSDSVYISIFDVDFGLNKHGRKIRKIRSSKRFTLYETTVEEVYGLLKNAAEKEAAKSGGRK